MESWRKLLKSKNIILFDHDYRISLHRYNQVLEEYNKLMIGGGKQSKKKSKNLLKKLDENISRIFIEGLINMNFNKVSWIIKNYVV
jgi:phage replication-related protein YjqB (UPF0714/DUF867 family)